MKRLTRILLQSGPNQYLLIVAISIATLTSANLFFSALMFELGHQYKSILAGPDDRFADLIKISLSYKEFVPHLEDTKGFQSWPNLFKDYYRSNPYGERDALVQGTLTHFQAPPLSVLFWIACATLIAHTQSAWLILLLAFLLYLVAVQWATAVCIPKTRRTTTVLAAVWFMFALSYPAMFVFMRGHFIDGIASVLIVVFLLRLFGRGRSDAIAIGSLAIALNIRPDAIVYVLAITIVLGFKRSIRPILYLGALSSGILASSYVAVHALYRDYTVGNFVKGLKIYNKLYVDQGLGDAFNSALFAFVRFVIKIGDKTSHHWMLLAPLFCGMFFLSVLLVYWGVQHRSRWIVVGPLLMVICYSVLVVGWDYHQHPYKAFIVASGITIVAAGLSVVEKRNRTVVAPFVLGALFCLVKPVFGDYNLLVFSAPILLIFLRFQEWPGRRKSIIVITLGSIAMLAPKNYYLGGDSSIQLLLNPLILYICVLYLAKESIAGVGTEESC